MAGVAAAGNGDGGDGDGDGGGGGGGTVVTAAPASAFTREGGAGERRQIKRPPSANRRAAADCDEMAAGDGSRGVVGAAAEQALVLS